MAEITAHREHCAARYFNMATVEARTMTPLPQISASKRDKNWNYGFSFLRSARHLTQSIFLRYF